MTPTDLYRLAGLLHHLPDARDLRLLGADGTPSAPHPAAVEVYAAVPELVEMAVKLGVNADVGRPAPSQRYATPASRADDIRAALRLPASTPWADVLARARRLADLDPWRTLDDEGPSGGDGGGR